ncbi:MAG TPA: aldehyde dehydrogenase family protein [Casimicrobiaceae bacterium]|jgi:sulfoacetaldehyde dehydrogenase|nr:aldehyde dehydrogenase family protein [Casimicrobiaceae bacterium]
MGGKDPLPLTQSTAAIVTELVARARAAQAAFDAATQDEVDEVVTAVAWAIVDPEHNRALAELAVRDTGLGTVGDKMAKNRRKTMGLLRDLTGSKSVGVIAEDSVKGLVEIARPVGVVGAITPSTNPAATPANNIINALKGRNAIIVAPSPKGASTLSLLLAYVHAELDRVGVARDLVQQLPSPVTREATAELMRQVDLVIATGSRTNVRAAYESGTPAIGVGAGNVAVIVDETADLASAADKIAASKTFDNATSCSSENSVIAVEAIAAPLLAALGAAGGVLLESNEARALERAMFADARPLPAFVAQNAAAIALRAGLARPALLDARFLIVAETGVGREHPFSGEKLSPVLAFYRVPDFAAATALARALLDYQGAGHSVGLHTRDDQRALELGHSLPVCRVIVNQAHCFATGGSFDNALPFSLSMGCGTWGRNSISDNLNYRHFLNITRVVRPFAPDQVREPTEEALFGSYRRKYGL